MCAVLDANIAGELFRRKRKPIPDRFYGWMTGRGRLVVGGRQWKELRKTKAAGQWLRQGIAAGRVRKLNDDLVRTRTEELAAHPELCSDDPHVLAVALVGGARLLYSNDEFLQEDFTNLELVRPKGRIYTSKLVQPGGGRKKATQPRRLTKGHKELLRRTDLCAGCD